MSDTEVTITDEMVDAADAEAITKAEAETAEEKPDYEAIAVEAFTNAASIIASEGGLEGEALTEFQTQFRSIPSAARAKAQGAGLKAVMAAGHADAMEALLDATQNMPAARARTGRARKQVDPKVTLSVQAASLLVAFADLTSDEEIGAEVAETAKSWYSEGVPEEHRDAVLKASAAAIKASASRTRGGGNRNTYTDTLADVVGRNPELVDAVLTFPGDFEGEPRLTNEGVIVLDGEEHSNPTSAAIALRGGKGGSGVNGWDFFSVNDQKLGSYRVG